MPSGGSAQPIMLCKSFGVPKAQTVKTVPVAIFSYLKAFPKMREHWPQKTQFVHLCEA